MKLLIISHTDHYIDRDGVKRGWGPTVREISNLAGLFSEVCHIACFRSGPVPESMIPYEAGNVRLVLLPPSGGPGLRDKLGILKQIPAYIRTILRELPHADAVHVRAPANISLLAMVLLAFINKPRLRWIKYAGNWQPQGRESWSYSFQRWWLKRGFSRAIVTVNGEWPGQPHHVHSFYNPCLTEEERLEAGGEAVARQIQGEIRLIFVGRVESAKGVSRVIDVLSCLKSGGCTVSLDVVGDGPERSAFEYQASRSGLVDEVRFHGWIPRPEISRLYAQAHLILLPSSASEGWPKVLSEAMAYGVVPIAGNISSIGQYLSLFGCGRALPPDDLEGFVEAVRQYAKNPTVWKAESQRGVAAAANFTYEAYLGEVSALLGLPIRRAQ